MKLRYVFVTGEESVVEVEEELGMEILAMRRAEHANNEKQRYHSAVSLDDGRYSFGETVVADDNVEAEAEERENSAEVEAALAFLTPIQRRRFRMLMDGLSMTDIARAEGTSLNSVKESVEAARRKLGKIYNSFS